MSQIIAPLMPDLLAILGSILGVLASWALFKIKKRIGVDIKINEMHAEEQLRDLLTRALINGAKSAITRSPAASDADHADLAVAYVKESIPQTLLKLGVSNDVLRQRAFAILFDLLADHLIRKR